MTTTEHLAALRKTLQSLNDYITEQVDRCPAPPERGRLAGWRLDLHGHGLGVSHGHGLAAATEGGLIMNTTYSLRRDAAFYCHRCK